MHTKKFGITLKSVKRFLELGANLNIIRICPFGARVESLPRT